RRGEVAFEAGEFEVGGVALVSHGRITREGVVDVTKENQLRKRKILITFVGRKPQYSAFPFD
ncbi:MAG: hypothetical protein SPL72_06970, partial [Cyanobacteriota bacterium]|nr:hypothetical protein [Cyanobacteriota bacterium]